MSFESNFSYQGVPRLSYFWANPNHAAAVLVALIGIFWVLRFHTALRGWRVGLYAFVAGLELFWSLMIGWTCSRGALVAWVAALIAFGLLKAKAMRGRGREAVVFWILSTTFLFVALLATGTGSRFVDIADGDRSALNRLGIWSNALELIYAAPWSGWGAGQSGNALVHWFAPVDSTKEYAAIVGTYLHIGAEFGLVALTALLAILGMTLWIGHDSEKKLQGWRNGVLTAAVVGLVAFLTAGLFSTLWVSWMTSGVVPLAMVLIWSLGGHARAVSWRAILRSLLVAVLAGAAIYGTGAWVASRENYTVRKTSGGVVIAKTSAAGGSGEAVFLVDGLVLGTFYGKPMRRITEAMDRWTTVHVYTDQPAWSQHLNAEVIILGPRIADVPKEVVTNAIVVAPVTAYSRDRYGVPRMVLLPEYDEFGHAAGWLSGLKSTEAKVRMIEDTGQDCSGRVLNLVKLFQEEAK